MSMSNNKPSGTPYKLGADPENIEVLAAVSPYEVSYLEGRLLTVIDASIGDPEQRKALKDIIRQNVWSWYDSSPRHVVGEHAKFTAEIPVEPI